MPGNSNGRILLNVAVLKYLRKKNGLTQDSLAQDCRKNRLAVSISSIKRAESGKKVLYRTAINLARFYGVDIIDIMCDSEVRPALPEPSTYHHHSPSMTSMNSRAKSTSPTASDNESRCVKANQAKSRYIIVLLAESKMTVEDELNNYLHSLNIFFTVDFPHIMVSIYPEDCDIEIFRFFKHLSRLLLTRFWKRIRMCAHVICIPTSTDEESSSVKQIRLLPDSVYETMHQILKLTAWDSISACARIVSSGVCTAGNPPSVADGWRDISATQPYTQFIGRQWELSQLCSCYYSITQSGQGITAYLDGLEGVGKTALIHRFIECINISPRSVVLLDLCQLSVARQPALQYLIRRLLNLPLQANDALARSIINSLTLSFTLQIFLCLLAGVVLLNAEICQIKAMTREYREAAIREALTTLIDMRTTDGQLLLVVEDICLADADFTEVIKLFSRLAQSRPFLLCISARKSGRYSHRPEWLEHACIIELTNLTPLQSMALANSVFPIQTDHSRDCISRAFGHPGYLLQMLGAQENIHDFKIAMAIATNFKLNRLSPTDVMALKIAAVYVKPISLEHWSSIVVPLLGKQSVIHTPQTLVYAGLFKHVADAYTFHHPAIRDVIMDCITKEEYMQFEHRIQQWKIKRDLVNELTI
jgi:transcriptional regulator with XRE-family HTH domain/Cdc6-like AAA superfamily ATPase